MSTKGCLGFFLFCLDLELFAKITETWFLHSLSFCTFLLTIQNLNEKKNAKWETCAKFHQKILKSMVVGARQSFQLLGT